MDQSRDQSKENSYNSYQINDKTYFQYQLVLGQINQLLSVLKDLPLLAPTPQTILLSLGEKIPVALAVILVPEGSKVKDRDLKAIEDDMYYCPADVVMQVFNDFLSLNPISLFRDKINSLKAMLLKEIPGTPSGKSNDSSTPSLAEIYSKGIPFSGL